jgi:UDPglucose 6-dehydrogenase
MNKIKVGIIGYGFVGKAAGYGFTTDDNEIIISDPLMNTNTQDVIDAEPEVTFICVPTPMCIDGSIDASIVKKVMGEIKGKYKTITVLKSTVTPEIVDELYKSHDNFVYNPEFLTEANAKHDFEYATHHVFGGDIEDTKQLEKYYLNNSICKPAPKFHMTPKEASFVKYGMNSFLATKVLFFNQFYDMCKTHNVSFNNITQALGADPRITYSHMQVPGPDGRRGYGGACFPKDTTALLDFSNNKFTVLAETIKANNKYRSLYELDDREKEQKVHY